MIPANTRKDLDDYRKGNHPYPFGSFLTAILANDLVGAVGAADDFNILILKDYASYLYNWMPRRTGDATCDTWGSYKAVQTELNRQITVAQRVKAPAP